jgi:CRISPR/Cas system-associated endonuclease Cas1
LRAFIRAKLEPYLRFLHSVQYGKPSLVCNLQELYRYLVDDSMIQFYQRLKKRDFKVKARAPNHSMVKGEDRDGKVQMARYFKYNI